MVLVQRSVSTCRISQCSESGYSLSRFTGEQRRGAQLPLSSFAKRIPYSSLNGSLLCRGNNFIERSFRDAKGTAGMDLPGSRPTGLASSCGHGNDVHALSAGNRKRAEEVTSVIPLSRHSHIACAPSSTPRYTSRRSLPADESETSTKEPSIDAAYRREALDG